MSNLTQDQANEQAINFLYFCHNYPVGWVKKAFKDHYSGAQHFMAKFSNIHRNHGAYSSVPRFMAELSDDNKKIVLNWVRKNYNYKP